MTTGMVILVFKTAATHLPAICVSHSPRNTARCLQGHLALLEWHIITFQGAEGAEGDDEQQYDLGPAITILVITKAIY